MGRIRGKNTKVYVSTAENGSTYVEIAQTTETDLFDHNTMSEEVTTLADQYTQEEPTMNSMGDMTFEIIFDNTDPTQDSTNGLAYLAGANAKRNFKFVLPNGKFYIYKQFIANMKLNRATPKGIIRGTITLKHYGDPVQL